MDLCNGSMNKSFLSDKVKVLYKGNKKKKRMRINIHGLKYKLNTKVYSKAVGKRWVFSLPLKLSTLQI